MKCPECGVDALEGAKFCEECGTAIPAQPPAPAAESASTAFSGGVGMVKGPVSVDQSQQQHVHYHGPPVGPQPADLVVACPLCGKRNRLESTFFCRSCQRDNICLAHFVESARTCDECAAVGEGQVATMPSAAPAPEEPLVPAIDDGLRTEVERDAREVIRSVMCGKGSNAFIDQACANRLAYWRRAAELGVPAGQWLVGCCVGADLAGDNAEAVRWYRMAAEQGYAPALHSLAQCHARGDGVAEDKTAAIRWFRRAADQGYPIAQDVLGRCYWEGEGVAADPAEAARWFLKAAEQGHVESMCSLAHCCKSGKGVPEAPAEAVRWYREAAGKGYAV